MMMVIVIPHDYRPIVLAGIVAMVAVFLALEIVARIYEGRRPIGFAWLTPGALVAPCFIKNSAGKASTTSSTLTITPDRHACDHEPREGDEDFHAIFEFSPFGMCVIGLNRRILHVNGALCRMLGYSAEELVGMLWTELSHPDDLDSSLHKMEQMLKEHDEYLDAEKRFMHRSGSVVWARKRISLARDTSGAPLHFVVHMEDITERMRTSRELRESEDRFRILAETSPSMMWVTDAEGNIQFFNKACRRFCGTDFEKVDRSQWKLLLHPDDETRFVTAFDCAIREHAVFSIETRIRRADGEWRLLGCRAEPRLSPSGEFLGHIGLCADITERIQAEQLRQFELSLIQSIHSETLEGILVVNGDGIVVSHNQRFLEIWKLPDSITHGELITGIVGAPDQPLLSSIIERVESPEPFLRRVQELYDHPDEKEQTEIGLKDGRTLERHSTGLRNQQGHYLGRVWFFRDVTAHKQERISLKNAKDLADDANNRLLAERSMIEKERQILRALIDNVPELMFVKDLQSRFMVVNSHFAGTVGAKTPEELVGKSDFDVFPTELATAYYKDDQNVIRSGEALRNREERSIDCAGNERYLLTTKVPMRDNNGHVTGIAGIGRDISDRKKMEDALREAERKYRGLFDDALVGIFQSTPEGQLLNVNNSMASTFGYDSPEELIACTDNSARLFYVDLKRREIFMLAMDKDGGVQNFECEVYRKDRSKIWLSLNARAIRVNGVMVRYEGMAEDITERNALREQLLQAQKLESVGQLASGIAHEINTPTQYIGDNVRFLKDAFEDLRSLLANYERLLAAAKDNTISYETIQGVAAAVECVDVGYLIVEIPKAIDQTLEGVSRVATLVSAMKEFSHPDTKDKVSVDLNRAIGSTITVARNEWKYVAEMETDFDPSLPMVSCLPGEFNQVILNLIVNAAHAIADVVKKGGAEKGKITVQTRNCPEWAEIRLQDTGTGIPEKVRGRIFDPFFTTKEIGKGTGQGLAIARSVIVGKHHGSIHFETEDGKGTTFIIRLPYNGEEMTPKAVIA